MFPVGACAWTWRQRNSNLSEGPELIPQRNISLLANRLAKAGGRRILESVLERDYCLAWFLAELAGTSLQPSLAFKGGTALKRCYFKDYRFSEDLDFTLIAPMSYEEIGQRLEPVYAAVHQASGIEFAFDREDRHSHANSHSFYLRYVGPLPAGGGVKVDIAIREQIVSPSGRTRTCCLTGPKRFHSWDRCVFKSPAS